MEVINSDERRVKRLKTIVRALIWKGWKQGCNINVWYSETLK